MDEFQGVPVALEHVDKKEFDAAIANTQSGSRPFIFVFAMQEIILKLHFGDLIGGFVVKIDEHSNGSCIALLSTLAHPGKLQGSHGLIVVILHHNFSPFV